MEASMDLFVNLIQNHRIVYDKSLKDFKNTKKKEEAWQDIAKQSRMTVDAVKKRYTSMRQKYCREKRIIEVNRRNKRSTQCNWIYFDHLHFLDSFIQPRSTYTNDPFVEEETDQMMGDIENETDQMMADIENPCNTSQNIEIELEEGVDVSELLSLNGDGQNVEGPQHPHMLVDESNQDSSENVDCEHSNLRVGERITSEYSGEESLIFYLTTPNPSVPPDENNGDVVSMANEVTSSKEKPDSAQSVDMDNYMSAFPSTSRVSSSKSSAPHGSEVSKRETVKIQKPINKPASAQHSLLQKQPPVRQSSGIASSVSRKTTNQSLSTVIPKVPTTSTSEFASLSSKDKRIEAIRQKMDSCLTAINNKVSDKAHRSPHAPFLAYLGTKLPNVPNEKLPQLERELLELVDFHST